VAQLLGIWHLLKNRNLSQPASITNTRIEIKNLTKIKPLSVIINLIMLLYLSACTYEPKTIVKTPRTSQASLPSILKETNSIKYILNVPLSNRATYKKKNVAPLPIIEINLSNFKRNLIGLNKFEITELLDEPSFKRREHPASIWQYQSSSCFVDIFFYHNKSNLIVDHVEIRSKNINEITEKQCFSSLLDSNYSIKIK